MEWEKNQMIINNEKFAFIIKRKEFLPSLIVLYPREQKPIIQ